MLAFLKDYVYHHNIITAEPLLKDTPELRTPLYKRHCQSSHLHTHTYKTTPELRTPLYKGQKFIPHAMVSGLEGFHCMYMYILNVNLL